MRKISFAYPGISWVMAIVAALPLEKEIIQQSGGTRQELRLETMRPKIEYTSVGNKDPFVNPFKKLEKDGNNKVEKTEAKEPPPKLTVQGIIWGGRLNQAIINNRVVKVGDILEGAQVVSIEKSGVIVSFKGEEISLNSPAAGSTGKAENPKR